MPDPFPPAVRSRIMAAVRSKNTQPELLVRRLLHRLGYRYRLHVRALPGTPDLVFPARRKVIFVSGCFWHMHACGRCRIPATRRAFWLAKLRRNKERDGQSRRALRKLGYRTLTVYECQLRNLTRLTTRLVTFLDH